MQGIKLDSHKTSLAPGSTRTDSEDLLSDGGVALATPTAKKELMGSSDETGTAGILRKSSIKQSGGFTIVELLLVTVVIGIVISGVFAGFISIYSTSSRDNRQLALDNSSQLAMSIIERDVRYSIGFDISTSSPFSDPYGPNNSGASWDYKGVPSSTSSRILILTVTATTQNALASTREVVYQTGTFACAQKLYNPQLTYRLIYFVRLGTLYRRILTDTTTTTCNGPQVQKQSCPPELGSWDAICKARDEIIAENVSSLSVDYYSTQPLALITDAYTSSAPDRLDNASNVLVSLTLSQGTSSPVTSTISLHTTRVNR